MQNNWHKVVDLNPKGRAEIHSDEGRGGYPEVFKGTTKSVQVTYDDLVEIRLEDGKPFVFPGTLCPFEIESHNGEVRVRFATAYHTKVGGRPEIGFAPNYLYLR